MKSAIYPEYLALLHAARALGRPVKWTDERSESFVSDSHGRDHEMTVELALGADGNFLAVRVTGYGNLGAYVGRGTPIPPTANAVKNTIGVYGTPLLEVSTKIVVTNTPPVGAYRGAGRPEGNYYMERLVDTAAAEMGIDRVELRRCNHIAAEVMPYRRQTAQPMTAVSSPLFSTRRWLRPIGTASKPVRRRAGHVGSCAGAASAIISR
jgi:carbon-monoxide dehydrogenase large subunit